jgi:Fic family protein
LGTLLLAYRQYERCPTTPYSPTFVAHDLVDCTLERGFEFLQALDDPFQRAVYMMVLIAEAYPFADGNGRIARIMMNAELVARNSKRIIIPTAYRTDEAPRHFNAVIWLT